MILGITGGTGCGKTTFLELIMEHSGLVLDCDRIYHELLRSDRKLLQSIGKSFPDVVENGILHRKKLGNLVFNNEEALLKLNSLTHTAVKNEVLYRLQSRPKLAAIDAIALFEGGLASLCDLTVAISAPQADRVQRLMIRDGISQKYALSRIQAQHDETWFRQKCDYILENNGTREQFHEKCLAFLLSHGII